MRVGIPVRLDKGLTHRARQVTILVAVQIEAAWRGNAEARQWLDVAFGKERRGRPTFMLPEEYVEAYNTLRVYFEDVRTTALRLAKVRPAPGASELRDVARTPRDG